MRNLGAWKGEHSIDQSVAERGMSSQEATPVCIQNVLGSVPSVFIIDASSRGEHSSRTSIHLPTIRRCNPPCYVKQAASFEDGTDRVRESLVLWYGERGAPLAWQQDLVKNMSNLGYKIMVYERCVFVRRDDIGHRLFASTVVDDLDCAPPTQAYPPFVFGGTEGGGDKLFFTKK